MLFEHKYRPNTFCALLKTSKLPAIYRTSGFFGLYFYYGTDVILTFCNNCCKSKI